MKLGNKKKGGIDRFDFWNAHIRFSTQFEEVKLFVQRILKTKILVNESPQKSYIYLQR